MAISASITKNYNTNKANFDMAERMHATIGGKNNRTEHLLLVSFNFELSFANGTIKPCQRHAKLKEVH